jgi:hypothetical protein
MERALIPTHWASYQSCYGLFNEWKPVIEDEDENESKGGPGIPLPFRKTCDSVAFAVLLGNSQIHL